MLVVFGVGALKLFDQAFIVSHGTGGPDYSTYTGVLYIYLEAFHSDEFGIAAAAGIVLFVVIFVLTMVQRLTVGRRRPHERRVRAGQREHVRRSPARAAERSRGRRSSTLL